MALAGPVARRAAASPRATAVLGEARLTRADLEARVRAAADRLAGRGLAQGSRCLLVHRSPVDLLVALAACDRLGATAVVGDAGWPPAVLAALEHAVRPDLADGAAATAAGGAAAPFADGPPGRPPGDGATPWLATCTSGSTAAPRAVLRTRSSWSASYAPFTAVTGAGPGRTVLVPGPLSGSLFLYGAVHALAVGGPLLLAPVTTDLPWDIAHLVPAQLSRLLDGGSDLAGRTAVVAGAAVPASLLAVARAAGLEVITYYGAGELSFVAAGRAGAPLRPFPWVEVEERDGILWARSPYLALRCLGGPAGGWQTDGDGWATVGDRGTVDRTGGVVVAGRGDAAVVTGGATVAVEAVEAVLADLPGVSEVVVLGTPHPDLGEVLTAVVVAAGDDAGWRRAARARLAAAQVPRRWYLAADLPRTASGKPARAEIRRRLLDGSLGARRLP